MLHINRGGTQLYYSRTREPFTLENNYIFDPEQFPGSANGEYTSKIQSWASLALAGKRVIFIRRQALGDILMLAAVANEFRAHYKPAEVALITASDHKDSAFLKLLNPKAFDTVLGDAVRPRSYDYAIVLDDVLEKDHSIARYSNMSRINIFREFLGLPVEVPMVWDAQAMTVGMAGIVFCSSGKKTLKTLPEEIAADIHHRLQRISTDVLWIGENHPSTPEKIVSALRRAMVLVTMDTGTLWMAHYTRTPVVMISGATRGRERLWDHPLRPDGVAWVDTAKMVGCEPCFENRKQCAGKLWCMTALPQTEFVQDVMAAVDRVRWKK